MTINWNNIRIHQGSQDSGFEELCSQLFHNEPPKDAVYFERRGYRDAGLECAHILRDGSLHGMQAKFFTRAPSDNEWKQVDGSITDALAKNPTLQHLTISIPQNFDDPKRVDQVSAMDKWKQHAEKWQKAASNQGRSVEFELWGDTQLTERLAKPENRGKRYYFFNQEELTPEWFMQRVEDVAADARPRYTEELNVQLPIAQLFEGLGRTREFARTPQILHIKMKRSLAYLNPSTSPSEIAATITALREQGEKLCELLAGADWQGTAYLRLPQIGELADQVRDLAHDGRRILDTLAARDLDAARKRGEKLDSHAEYTIRHKHGGLQSHLWEIAGAGHGLWQFATSRQAELANQPKLLVTGRAGSGKTHLFVDVAKRRAMLGLPSLVMLGENFQDKDPLTQVIEFFGLTVDHDTFLQALETAAEASGGKMLLLLDALNEGAGLQLWPKRLGGLLTRLGRFPWLGVGLSVRTTYETVVIPESARALAIKVTHEGFAAKPEQAARAFFMHYGIDLPQIPLLNPEFTNPLFLKILCKGLQDSGKHEVPAGGDGITAVFEFLVDAVNAKLQKAGLLTTPPHENVIRTYLDRLSDALVDRDATAIPMPEAYRISQEVYPTQGYQHSLLALLLSEGLLVKEMILGEEGRKDDEGVSFAYQRLQDHEVAKRLLARHTNPANLGTAFTPDSPIGRLFADRYGFYRHQGLLEALAVQIPEQFGVELGSLFEQHHEDTDEYLAVDRRELLGNCLLESLLWRRQNAITALTFDALKSSLTTRNHEDRYLDILLMLAAIPGHPLNADRLDSLLRHFTQPERDRWWMAWMYECYGEESALDRLITWALLYDDKSHLSDEAVLLACVALAWLTSSTVRPVRDRATKALVRLLTPRPQLLVKLLERFADVDDLYVTERLYAAAYGVALRHGNCVSLAIVAEAVYARLFAKKPILPHIMVRDYGCGVIDRAVRRGCALSFDPTQAYPPYGSDLPVEPPPRSYFEGLYKRAGEWTDRDRAIAHVVDRFGEVKYDEYFGGPSFLHVKFSTLPLTEPIPASRRQRVAAWEASLTPEQQALWTEADRLRFASIRIVYRLLTEDSSENTTDPLAEAEEMPLEDHALADTPDSVELVQQAAEAENAAYEKALGDLERALTPEQAEILQTVVLNPPSSKEEILPRLHTDLFARWVIQRALAIGWSAERFADFDAQVERMRDHIRGTQLCETIGAKYLWTAYYEVLARLADNYYLLNDYGGREARPYSGSWDLNKRTIDPSLLPNEGTIDVSEAGKQWWMPSVYPIDDVRESHSDWLQHGDDLPDIGKHLLIRDPGGVEWIALECYPRYDQRTLSNDIHEGPQRNLWLQLRGYLVNIGEAGKVFAWMREQDFMNRWMPEGGEFHDIFFGELYDSTAWEHRFQDDERQYQDWQVPERGCPAALAHTGADYSQSSDDASTPEAARIMVPAPFLVHKARLQWGGEPGIWLDNIGKIVVMDPSAQVGGRGALLIRKDFLDQFLKQHGFGLLWTTLGEKLVLQWDDRYPRLRITGAAMYTACGLETSIRSEYLP